MTDFNLFPLRPFAKLFETSQGQVLCTSEENEEGNPSLCFKATIESGEVICLAIGGWPNDDAGWEKADKALEGTTAEQAENFVAKVIPQMFGLTGAAFGEDETDED